MSKIIVFEGPEGSGKSTQAKKIYRYLKEKEKKKVILFREPGGTKISEQIRKILLDINNINISKKTEFLLYMASRAQLIEEKVKKYLKTNYIIIFDRFYLSTIVYQGYGRNLSKKYIDLINKFVIENITPDLTLIYDISFSEYISRLKKRKKKDRIDKENENFHKKIRYGYLQESKKIKNCYVIYTDKKNIKTIFNETIKILKLKKII